MDLYITIFLLFIISYYIGCEKLRMDRANLKKMNRSITLNQ